MTFRCLPILNRSAIFRSLAGMAFAFFSAAAPLLIGHAQQAGAANLTPPQTVDFPSQSVYLDVYGEDGSFLHGLQPDQITLLEDGEPVPVAELRELQPGVDVYVAINAGPPLAIRDNRGVSRYDGITTALTAWAGGTSSGPMRYSLVVNGEPPITAMETRQAWLQAFQAYQPDLRNTAPSLESLARAIDLSSLPVEEIGMDRAILYITPPMEEALAEMDGLTTRAVEAGVSVFVWMVASSQSFGSPGAQALERLAVETGGQFFAFSGPETLPDPQDYLGALGSLYRLQYFTTIRTSGNHSLSVRIEEGETTITAPEVTFRLNVMPPNPIFLSPPLQVVRTFPEDSTEAGAPAGGPVYEGGKPRVDLLTPKSIPIQMIIEFPDGHVRQLAFTRLYVDDQLAHENTEEPFDRFAWNLEAYTASGTHRLRLEARDTLGMSQSSLEMPVDVEVIIPPRDVWKELVESGLLLNGGAVLITGAALTAVLVIASRRARSARLEEKRRHATGDISLAVEARQPEDRWPDTQAGSSQHGARSAAGPGSGVPGEAAASREGFGPAASPGEPTTGRTGWFRRSSPAPEIYLVRVGEDGSPIPQTTIPLTRAEVTFGRDPNLATCLLDDPSVDGLHARLRVDAVGRFLLADQGSIAGTWVNYAPISSEGTPLEHGDLIHFGRAVYRFQLGKPPRMPKPSIRSLDPEEPSGD